MLILYSFRRQNVPESHPPFTCGDIKHGRHFSGHCMLTQVHQVLKSIDSIDSKTSAQVLFWRKFYLRWEKARKVSQRLFQEDEIQAIRLNTGIIRLNNVSLEALRLFVEVRLHLNLFNPKDDYQISSRRSTIVQTWKMIIWWPDFAVESLIVRSLKDTPWQMK